MKRLLAHSAVLLVVAASTSATAHAQSTSDDTAAAADEAGVDVVDLEGAMHTTGLDARAYLTTVGELAPVQVAPAACGLPICGTLGQRLYCIESFESHHNGAAVNRSSGAAGWLQWLPSTARTWGVSVGDRWSEWSAAERIAGFGGAFFRSQWPVTSRMCP